MRPATSRRLSPEVYEQTLEGYLQEWLREGKGRIAERGSEAYVAPRVEELLFFDEEILTPLLRTVRPGFAGGSLSPEGAETLTQVRRSARLLGYEVVWYRHRRSEAEYLVLLETREPRSHWGTYVLRLGDVAPFVLEVPRPIFERSAFEAGLSFFERLNADALLIAGSHPYANAAGDADVVLPQNQSSVFSLANQALLREAGAAHRLAVVLRAFAERDDEEDASETPDALVALSGGVRRPEEAGTSVVQILDLLSQDERSALLVDGSRVTAGYEVANLPQARYLDQTDNKQVAVVWLSSTVREQYEPSRENLLLTSLLDGFDWPRESADVRAVLRERRWAGPATPRLEDLLSHLTRVLESADPVALERARRDWSWRRAERLLDVESGQEFLIFEQDSGVALAINLQGGPPFEPTQVTTTDDLDRALDARRTLLVLGSGP